MVNINLVLVMLGIIGILVGIAFAVDYKEELTNEEMIQGMKDVLAEIQVKEDCIEQYLELQKILEELN